MSYNNFRMSDEYIVSKIRYWQDQLHKSTEPGSNEFFNTMFYQKPYSRQENYRWNQRRYPYNRGRRQYNIQDSRRPSGY